MKRIHFLLLSMLITFCIQGKAQQINGQVIDTSGEPIDAVAVILQTRDSVFVDAVITDEEGTFSFPKEADDYLLYFQHVLYESFQLSLTKGQEAGVVRLKEKEYALNEITVTAEKPRVKVEGGALIYDTPQIIKDKPVTNAFDAVRELPGITGTDESIELVGAANLHIVINGKLTTMTLDQLISLLKTIPSSRVKSTEIMYNAPARYNVKGALINVVLDEADGASPVTQGEVGGEYRQHHYGKGTAYANITYANGPFNMDLLANGRTGRSQGGEDMFARHTLDNQQITVDQYNRGKGEIIQGSFRLGMNYTFKNEDKLSATYFLDAETVDGKRTSKTKYTYPDRTEETNSRTNTDTDGRLQNVQLQYQGHQGITAGIDYTNYHSPDHQHFINYQDEIATTDLLNDSKQDIHKGLVFINHAYQIQEKWNVNYGVNTGLTRSETTVDYSNREGNSYIPDLENSLHTIQKEYTGNAFAELSHSFGKFSMNVSLKVEYFRSDYESNGLKRTLWEDWALFPNGSLSYTFTPFHILQFTMSSDKKYPSYWSVNPQTTSLNSYSVIQGNPELKPSRSYEGQLVYIFKQKYTFLVFADYVPDKFTQLPYQSSEELMNVFRFENLDYSLTTGLGIITPFRIGNRLNSRVTLMGMRLQEKSSHFHDISFNNTRLFGRVAMNNTVTLSESKPNLKLSVDGYYISPAQQGIYRLGAFYDVSAGLKWLFAGDKASLTLKYNNIFRSNTPRYVRVDTGDQYSNMRTIDDGRFVGLAFSWKFGGYKEKQFRKVDNSRFGK